MIEVRGLGNDIYELMLANAQNNIIQSVRTSASYGNTTKKRLISLMKNKNFF